MLFLNMPFVSIVANVSDLLIVYDFQQKYLLLWKKLQTICPSIFRSFSFF